jgi:predicted ATPase
VESNGVKKYVLTGVADSGIEAIFAKLYKSHKGYYLMHNAAQEVAKKANKKNNGLPPPQEFWALVAKEQYEWERTIPKVVKEAFLYGGIPDCLAQFENSNGITPEWIRKACAEKRYDKVFMLEPMCNGQDTEVGKAQLNKLYDAYNRSGYVPIKVPAGGVEERINLILSEIRK